MQAREAGGAVGRRRAGERLRRAILAGDMVPGQLVRHQFQLSLRPGRPQVSLPEHLAIIAAIAGCRPAEAEEAARRHLRSVITALLEQQAPGKPDRDPQEETR